MCTASQGEDLVEVHMLQNHMSLHFLSFDIDIDLLKVHRNLELLSDAAETVDNLRSEWDDSGAV